MSLHHVVYQLLRSLPALGFVKKSAVCKKKKKTIFSTSQGKNTNCTSKKQFCLSVATNRFIDIVSIFCIEEHALTYCLI